MEPNQEIEDLERFAENRAVDDSESVDDFFRQLEEKEKDLHITSDMTIIEIAESFDDGEMPNFLEQELNDERSTTLTQIGSGPAARRESADVSQLEREIADLNEKVAKLEGERYEIVESSNRRARDFESYKTRIERARKDTFQSQLGNLATQMLPALDNLNRAVDFAVEMSGNNQPGMQQFFDGIILVSQQLSEVLANMGIQPIATIGEVFDPHFHEAVATDESGEFPNNVVCAELIRGYRIGDRVIRHSMVKVSKRAGSAGIETTEDDAEDEEDAALLAEAALHGTLLEIDTFDGPTNANE